MQPVKQPDETPAPPPLLALIGRAEDAMAAELLDRLSAAGFGDQTLAQSRVFGAIPAEGIRLTDLADRLHTTKQAAGELVDQIEAAGYVERTPDPSDARAKVIRFTEKGWRAVRTALGIFGDIESELELEVGASRMQEARATLEAVVRMYPGASGDQPEDGGS